ncbi:MULTISPECIES: YeiH family protein [Arthrobacter]|uniref:Putative sulfate exporter family transporter n=1 Tax=Arthrobacter psychrochitiniphilus TaxID=291045 RepID=A0A2V3DRE8_9MICC|nr:putative sulfate exporter family transporter [Arthrobacter psychrochitiniphilus]NYG17085.1 putative integral membrane protein (TIGR00698 family) [Arthrobacter psychrochitiniphilus]PXA65599.1 putative sulfate exporter family transporter [Arthrobacter psychrochitiniphilus]
MVKPDAGRQALGDGIRKLGPGMAVAFAAVALSLVVHALIPMLPAMTVAVVLGIAAVNLPGTSTLCQGPWRAGLNFAGKHLMRVGIVFLGLKLSLGDIMDLGWFSVALVVTVVLLSFAGTYALGKLFRLAGDLPLLIATGFSICGASAIGAMAAVKGTKHEDTVLPVALVTLCGTLAIGVLPLLMHPLGLSALQFGQWVGAGVHDVGQVVATAQTAGNVALSAAVVIKLTRVVLLAPIVGVAGGVERRRQKGELAAHQSRSDAAPTDTSTAKATRFPPVVPLFVVGFLLLAAIRTTGWLPQSVIEGGALAQDIALGAALFGLGSSVRVRDLLATGLRATAMAMCAWALIAALAFGAVHLMTP